MLLSPHHLGMEIPLLLDSLCLTCQKGWVNMGSLWELRYWRGQWRRGKQVRLRIYRMVLVWVIWLGLGGWCRALEWKLCTRWRLLRGLCRLQLCESIQMVAILRNWLWLLVQLVILLI